MLSSYYQDSFTYSFFCSFYTEVLREKEKALSKAGIHLPELDPPKIKTLTEQIIGRLELILRDGEEKALKSGSYTQQNFKICEYIVVALADEIFLNLNWQGKAYWDQNILESRIFSSRKAGEKFFQDLDQFLSEGDFLRGDLAAVFLEAIALGFQGKYRYHSDLEYLDIYLGKLYEYIYHQLPPVFTYNTELFPEAYAHTIDDVIQQKLPDPHRWYYYYMIAIFAFLSLTYVMWFDSTFEIKTALYELIQIGKK